MAETIRELSFSLFQTLLDIMQGGRAIESVHLHHTWRPRKSEFRGKSTVEAMQRYHRGLGWSDIAQHLTIAPDGRLWSGRSWHRPPASVRGHNGTAHAGPFMIEIVGDFDEGQDQLDGAQRRSVIAAAAAILRRFSLPAEAILFHRDLSDSKTCPGTSLDPEVLRDEVAGHSLLTDDEPSLEDHPGVTRDVARGSASLPRSPPALDDRTASSTATAASKAPVSPFAHRYLLGYSLVTTQQQRPVTHLSRDEITAASGLTPPGPTASHYAGDDEELIDGGELPGMALPPRTTAPGSSVALRDVDTVSFDPQTLRTAQRSARARRHTLVLDMGRLHHEGARGELDSIFAQHLPAFLARLPAGQTPRVVVFAHGGLVDEAKGLAAVERDLDWWLDNGVYPIFLIWRTGWLEVFGQLWHQEVGLRGLRSTADRLLERTLGPLARLLWNGIKRGARLAAVTDLGDGEPGAAYLLAHALRRAVERVPQLEIHTLGHSAGSILLAHFLEVLTRRGGPAAASMHLLAPAISLDLFERKVVPRLDDQRLRALTLYTMRQEHELADTVIGIYGDSLLYFVSRAAETQRGTPILGLEESVRASQSMVRLFGLEGDSHSDVTAIWSPTTACDGRSSSRALTHGAFDEDASTMDSVLRRILALEDDQPLARRHGIAQGRGGARFTRSQTAPTAPPSHDADSSTKPGAVMVTDSGESFLVGRGVGRALDVRPYVPGPMDPRHRPLHIYTRDPDTSQHHGRTAVVHVPYEPLEPGPKGALFEVVDHDDTYDLSYEPVDLDNSASLIHQGLSPSTTDPRFAQQMVYAVCQRVYGSFRAALGRDPCWGFDRRTSSTNISPAGVPSANVSSAVDPSMDDLSNGEPSRLRLRPHAFEDQNAYYSKSRGELSFGYFPARSGVGGRNQEGSRVYSALSHDIVVHEMSHALLDGLRARFLQPSNRDVLAFHEGFADLVAVFSNFSYGDVLESAIREAKGSLDSGLLIDIASQFGRTTGDVDRPLRTVVDADGCFYDQDLEQHQLGSVLASSVFDAFRRVFEHKTRDLRHFAASHVRPGAPMPDQLVRLLARRASKLAEQFLAICIRAIDYCPPVDLTFGEYLRALVTADFDLVPDDPWGYREALVDAFRRRRVEVPGVPDLSQNALLWRAPEFPLPPIDGLRFEGMRFSGEPIDIGDRQEVERRAAALGEFVTRDGYHYYFGLARGDEPQLRGDSVSVPVVESIRNVQRVGPDGKVIVDQVAEVLQERRLPSGQTMLGGSTILVAHDGHVRFAIGKGIASHSRERRISSYFEQPHVAEQLAAARDEHGGLLGLVHRQRMAYAASSDD